MATVRGLKTPLLVSKRTKQAKIMIRVEKTRIIINTFYSGKQASSHDHGP